MSDKEKLQREIDLHCDFNNYLLEKIEKAGKEIERLTKQNKALNEMYELTKKEYIRLNNIINELENYLDNLHWFRLGKKEENGNMEYFYASVSNFYEDTKSILKGER